MPAKAGNVSYTKPLAETKNKKQKIVIEFFNSIFWKIVSVATLLTLLLNLSILVYNYLKNIEVKRRNKKLVVDLHNRFSNNDIKLATHNTIKPKYYFTTPDRILQEDLYIENDVDGKYLETDVIDKPDTIAKDLFTDFSSKYFDGKNDEDRYFFIFGSMGMGKTVCLLNLYIKFQYARGLKSYDYNVDIYPLGDPNTDSKIRNIQDKENTILLLDAFDEDTKAIKNWENRLADLLELIKPFRKVVITCRTQFFPTQKEEPLKTGHFIYGTKQFEFKFKKIYLSEFTDKDISRYINKKYLLANPLKWRSNIRARSIINRSRELMRRAVILSHINTLVSDRSDAYKFKFNIYDAIINGWIDEESRKANQSVSDNISEVNTILKSIAVRLALDMYNKWSERGVLAISTDEILPEDIAFIDDNKIFEHEQLGSTKLRSYPLIIRDKSGHYKFAHRSILEFFIAKEAFQDRVLHSKVTAEKLNEVLGFVREQCYLKIIKPSNGAYYIPKKTLNLLGSSDFSWSEEYKSDQKYFDGNRHLRYLSFNDLNKVSVLNINLQIDNDIHVLCDIVGKNLMTLFIMNDRLILMYFIYHVIRGFTQSDGNGLPHDKGH